MAYETTSVSVEKSQSEIRRMLSSRAARQFAFGEEANEFGARWAALTFRYGDYVVRMRVPYKTVDQHAAKGKARRAHSRNLDQILEEMTEQEARRIWRVIAWNLKARLVAVDEQVETFAEAFLAHIVNPATNQTVYEHLLRSGSIDLQMPLRELETPE